MGVVAVLGVATVVFLALLLLDHRATAGLSLAAGASILLALLGGLAGGIALVSASRWLETREGLERQAQYRAQARERQESERERDAAAEAALAGAPSGATRSRSVEAILLVDLIQSTELIAKQGDVFFRDLLRRIEASFIPIAREHRSLHVDGHGDGLLFCFAGAEQALAALRGMYARVPAINRVLPSGVEVAFRGSLHVGETIIDARGSRTGLAVLKAARLGSAMESLRGRGAGKNCLVISAEAVAPIVAAGATATPLGEVVLRGFPGTHVAYEVEV